MYSQALPVGDWESERSAYSPKRLYARTKREEIVITEFMAERLRDRGVVVHGMHPGWADTEGVRRWMPLFRAITGPIIRTPGPGRGHDRVAGGRPRAARADGLVLARPPAPSHPLPPRAPAPDADADRQALWGYCEDALARAGMTEL